LFFSFYIIVGGEGCVLKCFVFFELILYLVGVNHVFFCSLSAIFRS